ncbi:MAG TPA: zinc-finger domain-containing protein [Caulobacteraceae bacterium]
MARKAKPVPNRAPVPVAVDSVPPAEVIPVRSRRVACDGVGGALGHPRVWLEMGDDGFVECGYCDRRFVLAGDGAESERLAPGVYVGSGGH